MEKADAPSHDVKHWGQYALSTSVVVVEGVVGRDVESDLEAVAW